MIATIWWFPPAVPPGEMEWYWMHSGGRLGRRKIYIGGPRHASFPFLQPFQSTSKPSPYPPCPRSARFSPEPNLLPRPATL
ncbi:hypothetical protein AK812_SmicGene18195 [Symbiodinium microadriaticum]|uniref:Uncharacterized protein n=1 Tax=Symbiodinium microadriaticum TaxID=2951 RepID=A0A1Q9DVR5_SYMMI|nr:hypothetical protein AK812_SmicGene18195 [Symbiodinium microadriaticum]